MGCIKGKSLHPMKPYHALQVTGALFFQTIAIAHPDHSSDNDSASHELMSAKVEQGSATGKVSIKIENGYRLMKSNGIPDHQPGEFPRRGNPNKIQSQSYQFRIPLSPKASESPVQRGGFWWGVAINGVPFEPGTAESWNNDMRSGWRYEAATGFLNLGLDENNAHVQPNGAYHYHAMPTGLVKKHGGDENTMLLVAWAADGFPVYTDQGHAVAKDAKSALRKMKSSYQLKKGQRPAPPAGPGGDFDGRFTQDFAFVAGSGDLDECNGRFGVTPEFPQGTYYYCISKDFPFVARLWRGEPDASFRKAEMPPGTGPRPAPLGGAPRGIMEGPPLPDESPSAEKPQRGDSTPLSDLPPRMPIVGAIDQNGDGTLDAKELAEAAKGLKSLDKNQDGQLTPEEYRGNPPGGARPGGRGAERAPF
jgi:hypothetical protein